MTNTQQPTIPAEDGEIEKILSSLLIATQLTTIGDNGLQAVTSTYAITPEMLAEAKQKLLAINQRIALESRISERKEIALDNYQGQTFSDSTNWHGKFDKFVENNEKRIKTLERALHVLEEGKE